MAGDMGGALHNDVLPEDVNVDSYVTPYDALAIINRLNSETIPAGSGEGEQSLLLDVNDDTLVTPLDALLVINHLNAASIVAVAAPVDPDSAVITEAEVQQLLERASRATASEDAIIAIVDRGGRILGVRTEAAVEATFAGRESELVFAIDGAVAKARTAAFFSSNAAPLTSRTIRFISQSTITQREVESTPNVPDPNSIFRGPGFVAPIGIGGHFPPEITNTPPVDLFAIEHQSRDSTWHPGLDGIKGNADDLKLSSRFDVDLTQVPDVAQTYLTSFPESYGLQSGRFASAQSRGIATLPGGLPLYKSGNLVGGIGVFFPGQYGFASQEQGFVHASQRGALGPQTEKERLNAPKVLESEFIAYFAAGGTVVGPGATPVDEFEGAAPGRGLYGMPIGRIDLVGITLEIFGPHPTRDNPVKGPQRLLQVGRLNGGGRGANSGSDQPVTPAETVLRGRSVPEGWLVRPHDSAVDAILSADVDRIISQGIAEANLVRAAIRLDANFRPGARTRMVFAVTDSTGEVLGLYRMPDATIFSIDVAVAKARNTSYYAGTSLSAVDQLDANDDGISDVPLGTAFTNRTFRFLAEPRYPTGAQANEPGDFSILNDPGINPLTAENVDPLQPLPASIYAGGTASVLASDAFNVSRNFRDGRNLKKQNGVVFFPGSTPLYDNDGTQKLVGGFGVSGDGVDQDDVVTASGQVGFEAPERIRADQFTVAGVRLPFQKFLRNPRG